MKPLYHFSEDGSITEFRPRAPLAHPENAPLVWAIDEHHSPLYYLPRDCPRVAFWPITSTSTSDAEQWMTDPAARMVICVEAAWLERIQTCQLWRYQFSPDGFVDCHDHGVHTSDQAVRPLGCHKVPDLLAAITTSDVELRICRSLVPVAVAIQRSTLHFSLIRMRNAAGWSGPTGTPVSPN